MCFLSLNLVSFSEIPFHKLAQPPLMGISCSQPHILQKVASGISCPLCQEQTLFVSLELGLYLLIYLRDCIGSACLGVKPILTSVSHFVTSIKFQSTFSFPDCSPSLHSNLQWKMYHIFDHCFSLILFQFFSIYRILTGIRTSLVFKMRANLGYMERHNNGLSFILCSFS